jgi:hypothetical protein
LPGHDIRGITPQHLFKLRLGFLTTAGILERHAQIDPRLQQVGQAPDGFVEVLHGFEGLAVTAKADAQEEMGFAEIGSEANGGGKTPLGFSVTSQGRLATTGVQQKSGVGWI